MLLSGFAYKYKCGGCSSTYYDNAKCYFIVQIAEHLEISHLTGKKVKIDNTNPGIHLILQLRSMLHSKVSILIRKRNGFKLEIMQNRLITHDNPALKEKDSWLPLGLFWCNISGYHMIYCHIIWCPSVRLWVYNCRLFSFQYFVTNFSIWSKAGCISI